MAHFTTTPFKASLANPAGASIIESGDGTSVQITDFSNYQTNDEDGHGLTNFPSYRYIYVTDPAGVVTIYSSFGEAGTIQITPPSISIFQIGDMNFQYTIPSIGDGLYFARLVVFPDKSSVTYSIDDCVYDPGTQAVYKSLVDNNTAPVSDPAWEVLSDTLAAPEKYNAIFYFSRIFDVETAKIRVILLTVMNRNNPANPFYDSAVREIELFGMLESNTRDGLYVDVASNFELLKGINSCLEDIPDLPFAITDNAETRATEIETFMNT